MGDTPSTTRGARRRTALRTSTAAIAGSALAFGGAMATFAPTASASSHREAPLIANDPQADNTDVYAFVSPDKASTVTLIANWIPFEEPGGGPNFYPWSPDAHYDINLDTDGDSVANITYRWKFRNIDKRGTNTFLYNNGVVSSFNDPNLLFKQAYTLTEIRPGHADKVLISGGKVAPSNVGRASMPNYRALRNQAITSKSGVRNYVGQADDPFFLDLRVFDLLYGADLSETGADTLSGFNVNTIALQIPKTALAFKNKETVVGVWSTTERPSMRVQGADGNQTYSGNYVQVSRLGNPLVNEVVVPAGLKNAFNAIPPSTDRTIPAVVKRVTEPEVPKLIQAIYGIKAPATPRNDLVSIFLTGLKGLNQPKSVVPAEMLRLNTAIKPAKKPNRLGVLGGDVAGFPNGRRLTDDVVDIELQALEGAVKVDKTGAPTSVKIVKALAAGDRVNKNDKAFEAHFPYIALPFAGSRVRPGTKASSSGSGVPAPMTPSGPMNTGAKSGGLSPVVPAGTAGLGALLAMAGVALFRRERRSTVTAR